LIAQHCQTRTENLRTRR